MSKEFKELLEEKKKWTKFHKASYLQFLLLGAKLLKAVKLVIICHNEISLYCRVMDIKSSWGGIIVLVATQNKENNI